MNKDGVDAGQGSDRWRGQESGPSAKPPSRARRALTALLTRVGLPAPSGDLPLRGISLRLLLAVFLSTLLWARISADQDPVKTVTYNGVTISVPRVPGYYPVQGPPAATISVQGLASQLPPDLPPPTARVELPRAAPGAYTILVQVAGLPSGVLKRINPEKVTLTFERSASKVVAVVPSFDPNKPHAPLGFNPPTISTDPPTVTVTGPGAIVKDIASARVAVDTSNQTADASFKADQVIIDRDGHAVSRRDVLVQPRSIRVTVRVHRQAYPQQLPVSVVITGTVGSGYTLGSVTPSQAQVTVLSTSPVAATTIRTVAIDVSGWTSSRSLQPAQLIPPGGATLTAPKIFATIEVVPIQNSVVGTAGILVRNPPLGTTVTIAPHSVSVVYEGTLRRLRHARAPLASVNLAYARPGVYDLTPAVALGPGLTLLEVLPPRIRVLVAVPPSPISTVTPRATSTPVPTLDPTPRPTAIRTLVPTLDPTPRPTATSVVVPKRPLVQPAQPAQPARATANAGPAPGIRSHAITVVVSPTPTAIATPLPRLVPLPTPTPAVGVRSRAREV